jgi:nicotinamide-nucleotide amidase
VNRPRGVVVLTGSELVRGQRSDRNGPFLAHALMELGIEPARMTIVGDRPDELEAALKEGLEADLLVTSGGLGPTHDDRTVETLARVAGRALTVDPDLAREIEAVSRRIAQRLHRPFGDFEEGVRKQATIPAGAVSIGLAGTAPGLVLQANGSVVVVLPGPPTELQRLWRDAVASEPVRHVLERARPPERRLLRFYGASESAVAQALAEAGGDGEGVEATICAHDFEIHVDLVAEEEGKTRADELEVALANQLDRFLFARDSRPIEEIVLDLAREQGLTVAAAESCTGGLVGARLTSVPGSSDVFRGGIVAYDDVVKRDQLGVPEPMLEQHGAVSAEVAAAMARGARERLGADVGLSVTGIAGPGGGTTEKPVGLVYFHAAGPDGELAGDFVFGRDREAIRSRGTVAVLHLLRRLLTQNRVGST